ncbi:hypothetical protein M406DRAFT_75694 [Cryphonectria parasitica EP155]|uniref:Uncharacterized protein n=1 Tax=Cryphonectria parasitica (strain ATCC 38755 / EP155) TaxID=660469 RepID=A0A9P4XRF6_CRYP1|nr:uncharacterized protein M406DRAFT_75694 [Cryphonectria parasitica EP155]KAF3760147.1 hypothetical protein M406DRAFT_75694 [Cryphonectria parasitica EP155]
MMPSFTNAVVLALCLGALPSTFGSPTGNREITARAKSYTVTCPAVTKVLGGKTETILTAAAAKTKCTGAAYGYNCNLEGMIGWTERPNKEECGGCKCSLV